MLTGMPGLRLHAHQNGRPVELWTLVAQHCQVPAYAICQPGVLQPPVVRGYARDQSNGGKYHFLHACKGDGL